MNGFGRTEAQEDAPVALEVAQEKEKAHEARA
jgi:hypothetical protein